MCVCDSVSQSVETVSREKVIDEDVAQTSSPFLPVASTSFFPGLGGMALSFFTPTLQTLGCFAAPFIANTSISGLKYVGNFLSGYTPEPAKDGAQNTTVEDGTSWTGSIQSTVLFFVAANAPDFLKTPLYIVAIVQCIYSNVSSISEFFGGIGALCVSLSMNTLYVTAISIAGLVGLSGIAYLAVLLWNWKIKNWVYNFWDRLASDYKLKKLKKLTNRTQNASVQKFVASPLNQTLIAIMSPEISDPASLSNSEAIDAHIALATENAARKATTNFIAAIWNWDLRGARDIFVRFVAYQSMDKLHRFPFTLPKDHAAVDFLRHIPTPEKVGGFVYELSLKHFVDFMWDTLKVFPFHFCLCLCCVV